MFLAEKGKGAFLNDQRIRVAGRTRLADSVIACGLPHIGRGDLALAHKETGLMQGQVAGLRRFGAAALDLAWIAAGRLDGYWERDIKPWDIAAGLILVREAGGFVTGCEGNDDAIASGNVVAGNDTIQKELVRVLKEAGKG
jgi:myo-inositol-1(or 4)-monophosphatase